MKTYTKLSEVNTDCQFVWYNLALAAWKDAGEPEGEFAYLISGTNVELVLQSHECSRKYDFKKWRLRLCC